MDAAPSRTCRWPRMYPAYTTEQLERAVAEGRGTDAMRKEIQARKDGVSNGVIREAQDAARADALREAVDIANERGAWASNDLDADSLKDRLEANGRMDMAKEIASAIRAIIEQPTTTGET